MEKQLLFLLDWDLNISEDDLYTHLDPFLAPIRQEIELAEQEAARKKAIKEQRQLIAEDARRIQYEAASQYWLPAYQEKHLMYEGQYLDASRQRYDSPPSCTDVPGLARSGTTETLSTVSSSASSYISSISRSGTPESSIGSYVEELENSCSRVPGPYLDKIGRAHV